MIEEKEIELLDKYFRALNYLSLGQLYLLDNPLLRRPLRISDLKNKIVGHWGTVPGQNFIYTHLNRVINKYDLNMMYISGPGHGGNAIVANTYLEGSYSKIYPNITEDIEGMKKLFKQFSFPLGISSHVAPETPGSINEGGELGYSLSHAFGAVLDNPDLICACVVGDGEAETGPLATSWNGNKLINPKTDGAVLPILHLNGYKIANPTIFSRISNDELLNYFKGCGYEPYIVEDNEVSIMHKDMACALDKSIEKIKKIQEYFRNNNDNRRPIWPMIILKSKKGWTCPKEVDGKIVEDSFRAHQVPVSITHEDDKNLKLIETWLKSYKPEELFDENGTLIKELKAIVPKNPMGLNKHANGGLLKKELITPDFKDYKIDVERGVTISSDMMNLGLYIKDLIKLNKDNRNFRIFGPDEALSNRLNHVFDETNRQFNALINTNDEFLNNDGRVIDSFLSEHMCEGMLEGYLLTGRYGFFHTYEAFARIVDSMASQHAKWLKVSKQLPWRKDIASLNYILTSHIWQQDHNGYTHQDPGFLNHIATKKPDISRIYLPVDTNTLLSCFDHVIKTDNYINVVVASKHPSYQWLNMDEAIEHCKRGISIWNFASNDKDKEPDIVMTSIGDTPNIEVLAAIKILREKAPNLIIRMVNVIDLMKLVSNTTHPHGLTDIEYDSIFTKDKPVIIAFHGYPNLIHELIYKRQNKNVHVHGYKEEGTITTPFDMRVQNEIDRYHLIISSLKYVEIDNKCDIIKLCNDKLKEHKEYIGKYGIDMEEIRNWSWK